MDTLKEKKNGGEKREKKKGMEDPPAFCTCSSLLACSRMDLMASSEPASGVRTRAVMLPAGGDGEKKKGGGGGA